MTVQDNTDNFKILLVDDEPMVLEVSAMMLESLGHDVSAFTNPLEAIENFKQEAANYTLAVVDMMMPEMTGKELYLELASIRADIPVAISSGYQMNESDDDLVAIGIKGFINKPFSLKDLDQSIRDIVAS